MRNAQCAIFVFVGEIERRRATICEVDPQAKEENESSYGQTDKDQIYTGAPAVVILGRRPQIAPGARSGFPLARSE